MSGLLMHCGGRKVTYDQLAEVDVPEPRGRWHPIPFVSFVDEMRAAVVATGGEIAEEEFGLSENNRKFFALTRLRGRSHGEGVGAWELMLGGRSSIDQSLAAGIAAGSHVFNCDNLSFSGEVCFRSKHTTHILARLPGLMQDAMARLGQYEQVQQSLYDCWQRTPVSDAQVHDAIVRVAQAGVVPASQILNVVKEYDDPSTPEFRACPRTVWRLFNSVTGSEYLKGYTDRNPTEATSRTIAMTAEFSRLFPAVYPA
jgi:hypothetical protein